MEENKKKTVWVLIINKQKSKGYISSRSCGAWRGNKTHIPRMSKIVTNSIWCESKQQILAKMSNMLNGIKEDISKLFSELNDIDNYPDTFKCVDELNEYNKTSLKYNFWIPYNIKKDNKSILNYWVEWKQELYNGTVNSLVSLYNEFDYFNNNVVACEVPFSIHFKSRKTKISWSETNNYGADFCCTTCGAVLQQNVDHLYIPKIGYVCIFCMDKICEETKIRINKTDKFLYEEWQKERFMRGL